MSRSPGSVKGEVPTPDDLSGAPEEGRELGQSERDELHRVDYRDNVARRRGSGRIWLAVFHAATALCIIALSALVYNVANSAFGLVALESNVPASTLSVDGVPYEKLDREGLIQVLEEHASAGRVRALNAESPLAERSEDDLRRVVLDVVIQPRARATWSLVESLFARPRIESVRAELYPDSELVFRWWLNPDFISSPQSSTAEVAGVRTAIFGSLWTILITILVAFPLGVGAALYLEEYADQRMRINRVIQTNINNLAGVPSIIYGMLGLVVFVRLMEPVTSGKLFGIANATSANGRTILSAGLTLALLILPLIIINSQEAVRAVPSSLRQASFGLGATKWQTIWHHVLPGALPGVLTGTILAVSRAIGETAPLVVVGASTAIFVDPSGPFSKFTTLPIQVYQWTSRPQPQFRNIAAAAIIVLLVLLLSLNATAVLLRNRYQVRY